MLPPAQQDDLCEALFVLGQEPTEGELKDMIREVDANGVGEWCEGPSGARVASMPHVVSSSLSVIIALWSNSGSGFSYMGLSNTRHIPLTGDGRIDYEEFLLLMARRLQVKSL